MTHEQEPSDITDMPELVQIAEEVRRSNTPRVLRNHDRILAVVVPPQHSSIPVEEEVKVAKANLRKHFASVMPHNRPEDWIAMRREFEEAVAEDARTRGQ